jgi:peptide/nickel transport system ATP-binding protein
MKDYIIRTENLKLYYILPKGIYVKAVDGVNIEIPRRGVIGLVGESGSGKTTLGEGILYLIEPPMVKVGGRIFYKFYSEKEIDVEKMPLEELEKMRGVNIALIPQYAMNALNPAMKIGTFIKDVAKYHGEDPQKILEIAIERFKMLGLPEDAINRYPHELSGGMRQRAVTVISTLLNPKFVVADEPVSNLDVVHQQVVIDFLTDLVNKGIIETLMIITHDLPLILEKSRYLILMYGGHIVESGSRDDLWSEPLHPYTKTFLEAIPPIGARIEEKKIRGIPGNPPDLRFPPPGCRFHPRCPYAMDICRREEPLEVEIKPGRKVKCWLYVNIKKR